DSGASWTSVFDTGVGSLVLDATAYGAATVYVGTYFWRAPDAFAAKLDPSGSKVLFATYLGGRQVDTASGIAVDSRGGIYLAGWTVAPDLDAPNGFATRPSARPDAFVAKIDPRNSTALRLSAVNAVYGGATTLTATLSSGGT